MGRQNTIVLTNHPHKGSVGKVHYTVRIPWLKWTQPCHRQTERNCGPRMDSTLTYRGSPQKSLLEYKNYKFVYVCCSKNSFTVSKKRNANRKQNL